VTAPEAEPAARTVVLARLSAELHATGLQVERLTVIDAPDGEDTLPSWVTEPAAPDRSDAIGAHDEADVPADDPHPRCWTPHHDGDRRRGQGPRHRRRPTERQPTLFDEPSLG